ncbi:MAG: hypothetical protein LBE10_08640, partial [Treponema sp.]|nr:hypothetical protein [Treponema sp.]
MRYLIGPNNSFPAYVNSGELLNSKNFIHQDRKLETFVFILCIKGCIHIAQDDMYYNLGENQFLFL